MRKFEWVEFKTLPIGAIFLYNDAVHEKIAEDDSVNNHTLKTEYIAPDREVEAEQGESK